MVKITYTKVPADICRKNRAFYKNHVRKAFIAYVAYEGLLNGIFTKSEIKKAKRGQLPDDCNVHHRIPLSGSYDNNIVNSFENLTILHKNTHERINREIFQPQLNPVMKAPFGTQIEIDVPDFGLVDRKGIFEERKKEQNLLNFCKKSCKKR